MFKQRLIDCAQQEWHLGVSESPKLSFYASIKHSFEIERYLVEIPQSYLRKAIAKIRCSAHLLAIEKGRHVNIERENRLCMYIVLFYVRNEYCRG